MLLNVNGRLMSSQKPETVITDPKLALFASQADTAFKLLDLTVVCTHCGGTPVGQNAMTDTQWRLECACRIRVLRNPHLRTN